MKQLAIKVDVYLDKLLRDRSEGRKVALGRYVRSLIEKGMAVEDQIEQGHYADSPDRNKTLFDIRQFELLAEGTILHRKLLEMIVKSENEVDKIITDAEERSKSYVRKMLDKGKI